MNHSDNQMRMVAASFILALISILTFQIFFISLPCASVAIILALVSRGDGPLMPRAKAALITAVISAVLTTTVTMVSVYTVMNNPQLRARFEQLYNSYTDPEGNSDSSGSSASDGEDLLRDILSGQYRESRQESASDTSDGSTSSGSSDTVSDNSDTGLYGSVSGSSDTGSDDQGSGSPDGSDSSGSGSLAFPQNGGRIL